MANFDDMKFAVEALTGGKNTVILDDRGMPSVMVALNKFRSFDVDSSLSLTTHPAFILNSVEQATVYLSKFQNVVIGERAYSLPLRDPRGSITFDDAVTACRNKGEGWGLTPFALWSAVALWSKKNGTLPRGNNANGREVNHTHEVGTPTIYNGTTPARTATGSGPATWNHNWLPDGIADMTGNVHEWCAGMILMGGEIQIIPNADCMDSHCDLLPGAPVWKAILPDGTLVEPGTDGTLKYDYADSKVTLANEFTSQTNTSRSTLFESMGTTLSSVPQIIKELALYPSSTGYEGDYLHMINYDGFEAMPLRGGMWSSGPTSGPFCLSLQYNRYKSSSDVGFRSAYYGEI